MIRCAIATLLASLAVLAAVPSVAQETPCVDNRAGDYACSRVDLMARLPLNATPDFETSSSDVWGWTDPESGIEYAIVNQYDHTAFVDLSTPTAPLLVGRLAAPAESVARDAKTYGHYAIIGTDRGTAPVQIFDLRRLRDVGDPPVDFEADASYADGLGPHNIAVNEESGFAYFVYVDSPVCQGSLHIVDVRDPTAPAYAGCYEHPGSGFHDVQCVTYSGPDVDYAGREVCFGSAPTSDELAIVDVTDKQQPTLIAAALYPTPVYAHQGWLTDDGRYFLMDDEIDEIRFGSATRTLVFDVSDLDSPEYVFAYEHPTASTDHNLFVRGRYVFAANYTSGLRILDIANIADGAVEETGYFDTHPEGDPTGFDGAFGVYPYFESGLVVVTDMARGLFVLRPVLEAESDAEPTPDARRGLYLTAYPNPSAQTTTTLTLRSATAQRVTVGIYDVLGRRVVLLHEGRVNADELYRFVFDTASLPAGIYVGRADGETETVSRTLTRVR